jgi:multidrug transporter EmrE-like cation transporter
LSEISKLHFYGWIAFATLPFLGVLNAAVNIYARNSGICGTVWLFVTANIMVLPWFLLIRKSNIDLSVAGASFDAVYSLFYFVAIVMMGQPATCLQWIGACVTIVGIVLMAI